MHIACGEDRHLLLQCCKVGLVLKQECLAAGVGVGKIGHISSRTGMVDTGVSKCCFLVVQGLHSVGKERAEVRPGVLVARHCIPSVDLQGELGEHIEGILGITEFLHAVVLTAKILVDGATRVVGSIKEVSDFADVSSAKQCSRARSISRAEA